MIRTSHSRLLLSLPSSSIRKDVTDEGFLWDFNRTDSFHTFLPAFVSRSLRLRENVTTVTFAKTFLQKGLNISTSNLFFFLTDSRLNRHFQIC